MQSEVIARRVGHVRLLLDLLALPRLEICLVIIIPLLARGRKGGVWGREVAGRGVAGRGAGGLLSFFAFLAAGHTVSCCSRSHVHISWEHLLCLHSTTPAIRINCLVDSGTTGLEGGNAFGRLQMGHLDKVDLRLSSASSYKHWLQT